MKMLFMTRGLKFYDDGRYSGVNGNDARFSSWKVIDGKVHFQHSHQVGWRECEDDIQTEYTQKVAIHEIFEQEILDLDENQKSETINTCGEKE